MGEDLAGQFASLTGFHEHAFWTFLERPKYWQGALAFHHADTVPLSYWRKRKNVPRKPASVEGFSIRQLEQNLSNYFHKMQGRGENCKVDCYKRNELDYFFAYPEDYAQASVEWVGRPHHPAFEVIFVYSQHNGTLDIYLTGDRKPVPDLQTIFAIVRWNPQERHCIRKRHLHDRRDAARSAPVAVLPHGIKQPGGVAPTARTERRANC